MPAARTPQARQAVQELRQRPASRLDVDRVERLAPVGLSDSVSRSARRRATRSPRRRPLGSGIDRVKRLACDHEQPVAFGATEGDVATYLGQPNPTEQLARWAPDRDTAVADRAAGIACAPEITENVGAEAVGTTFHAVDDTVGEHFLVGQLVIRSDIEHVDVALAGRAGAGNIQLLEIG